MCTVTFIPTKNTVFLTSNRDEKILRGKALPPAIKKLASGNLLYPVDADKGGTWMIARDNGTVGVLLNGAETAHTPAPPYRKSRGLVLVEIMQEAEPLAWFSNKNLQGIEPFTLILYLSQKLVQCYWNGHHVSIKHLDVNKAYIWSSSTLYSPQIISKRSYWFQTWLQQTAITQEAIINFHTFGGDGDRTNDLLMKREGDSNTVSITSVALQHKGLSMLYKEFSENKSFRQHLTWGLNKWLKQKQDWFSRFWCRLTNWEYWPFSIVYIPVYFYWFWLCAKARSFFFFSAANPTIRNGGFLMESKKEIYDLLPPGTYPETVFCPCGRSLDTIEQELNLRQLSYPVIAKPDIGLRGMGLSLLTNQQALQQYFENCKVDFLVQEYVDYANEAGIFYCRIPGHKRGHITGIVGKQFLWLQGDGKHTILQLLKNDKRSNLQIPALTILMQTQLSEILAEGEKRLVVPFGNHSRGTKFLDYTHKANKQLCDTIDKLCRNINGFYFGRLDIKFNSWAELSEGKNFSIIELNGAGSEPAHIYDPKHNLFFAWKEIIRHLGYLYKVSKRNRKLKKAPYLSVKEGLKMFRDNKEQVKKIA